MIVPKFRKNMYLVERTMYFSIFEQVIKTTRTFKDML